MSPLPRALPPAALAPAALAPAASVSPASGPGAAQAVPGAPQGAASPYRARVIAWALCAAVPSAVLVAGLVYTGTSSSSSYLAPKSLPADARPLYLASYQPGDCLIGKSVNLGDLENLTLGPWPDPAWQVPCSQPHDAEVYYANNRFWPAAAPYPGNAYTEFGTSDGGDSGLQECITQFTAYVGLSSMDSDFSYSSLAPDTQQWQAGDRELACVAYPTYSDTTSMPDRSIRGSMS